MCLMLDLELIWMKWMVEFDNDWIAFTLTRCVSGLIFIIWFCCNEWHWLMTAGIIYTYCGYRLAFFFYTCVLWYFVATYSVWDITIGLHSRWLDVSHAWFIIWFHAWFVWFCWNEFKWWISTSIIYTCVLWSFMATYSVWDTTSVSCLIH